ncbi:hypothetical protein Plav_1468 [Parvibaculum lavamentivorans DS-1]|uniref:M23ase beta-sheet core domain-containing protein n=2 Tax=Parvibaculum lavamentivorans TaxID=256618 RepID=A7HT55_PARL1|nr:hypothetical protein Plav_1468 [Parvibaculum lavamentivorans DS-1]
MTRETQSEAARLHPEDVRPMRRIAPILATMLAAFIAIDDDARNMTAKLLRGSYALAAGEEAPLPLPRPPFLAVADLHECLRGESPSISGNAFADYCADLASFIEPQTLSAEALAATGAAETREEKKGPRGKKNDSGDEQEEEVMTGEAAPAELLLAAAPASKPVADLQTEPRCMIDASGAASTRIDGVWVKSLPKYVGGSRDTAAGGEASRVVSVPSGCEVGSPSDATVLYAGSFKGYLGVVILQTGDKGRITVAGLGGIAVARGDTIKRGAVLGSTSSAAAPALAGASEAGEATLLYVGDIEDVGEVAAASSAS